MDVTHSRWRLHATEKTLLDRILTVHTRVPSTTRIYQGPLCARHRADSGSTHLRDECTECTYVDSHACAECGHVYPCMTVRLIRKHQGHRADPGK